MTVRKGVNSKDANRRFRSSSAFYKKFFGLAK